MSIISKDISKAISILNNAELVAIPTETVYGLAGNIFSQKAITSIFKIKQRPLFNPLIVHIPSVDYLKNVVEYIPRKSKTIGRYFLAGTNNLSAKEESLHPQFGYGR